MEAIPAEFQWVGGIAFAIAIAVLAARSHFAGKKDGPAQPRVQEFYASGQLADMTPVKELVEQTGLLVQQQVRTNIFLERCASALERAASTYEGEIEDQQREREIEEEVARRLKDRDT